MGTRTAGRVVELYRVDGGQEVVSILEGKRVLKVARYLLQRLRSDWGRAFRVTKFIMDGGDGSSYDVLLGESCECQGYLRHGHCRHLESLAELAGRGEL